MGRTRAESGLVAEEQAALRRVATLVAGGAAPEAVFAVVAEEVGRLPGTDITLLARYDPDQTRHERRRVEQLRRSSHPGR